MKRSVIFLCFTILTPWSSISVYNKGSHFKTHRTYASHQTNTPFTATSSKNGGSIKHHKGLEAKERILFKNSSLIIKDVILNEDKMSRFGISPRCMGTFAYSACNKDTLRVRVYNIREEEDFSKACFSVMKYFGGEARDNNGVSACFETRYVFGGVKFHVIQDTSIIVETIIHKYSMSGNNCYQLNTRSEQVEFCLKWKDIVWGGDTFTGCLYIHITYFVKPPQDVKMHCVELTRRYMKKKPNSPMRLFKQNYAQTNLTEPLGPFRSEPNLLNPPPLFSGVLDLDNPKINVVGCKNLASDENQFYGNFSSLIFLPYTLVTGIKNKNHTNLFLGSYIKNTDVILVKHGYLQLSQQEKKWNKNTNFAINRLITSSRNVSTGGNKSTATTLNIQTSHPNYKAETNKGSYLTLSVGYTNTSTNKKQQGVNKWNPAIQKMYNENKNPTISTMYLGENPKIPQSSHKSLQSKTQNDSEINISSIPIRSSQDFNHPQETRSNHSEIKTSMVREISKIGLNSQQVPKSQVSKTVKHIYQNEGRKTPEYRHTNVDSPKIQESVSLAPNMHHNRTYKNVSKTTAESENNRILPNSPGYIDHQHRQTLQAGSFSPEINTYRPTGINKMILNSDHNEAKNSKSVQPGYHNSGSKTPNYRDNNINLTGTKRSVVLAPDTQHKGSYKPGQKTTAEKRGTRNLFLYESVNQSRKTSEYKNPNVNTHKTQGFVDFAHDMQKKGSYKLSLKTPAGGERNRIAPNSTGDFRQPQRTLQPDSYNPVIKVSWAKDISQMRPNRQEVGGQGSQSVQPAYQTSDRQTSDSPNSQGSVGISPSMQNKGSYKRGHQTQALGRDNRIASSTTGDYGQPSQTLQPGSYIPTIKVSWTRHNSVMKPKAQEDEGQAVQSGQPAYQNSGHSNLNNRDTNVHAPDSQGSISLVPGTHNKSPYTPGLKTTQGGVNRNTLNSTVNFGQPHKILEPGSQNSVIKGSWPRNNSVMRPKSQEDGGQVSKSRKPVYQNPGYQTSHNRNTNANSPHTQASVSMQNKDAYKPGVKTQEQETDNIIAQNSIKNVGQPYQTLKPGSYNPVMKVSWPRDNSKIAPNPQENGGLAFESRQPVNQNPGHQTPDNIDTNVNSPDYQESVGVTPIMHNKSPYKPDLQTAEGGGNRIVPNLTVNFSQPHQTYPGTYNQVIKVYWPKNNSVIRSKPQEDGWQASKSKQPVYQNQGHQTPDNTGNTVNLIDSQGSDHLVHNKEQHGPYKHNLKIQAEGEKNRIPPDSTGNFPHPHQKLKPGTYNQVIKVFYPRNNSVMSLKPQEIGGQTPKVGHPVFQILGHQTPDNRNTNVNSPDTQASVSTVPSTQNKDAYKPGVKTQEQGRDNRIAPSSIKDFGQPYQTLQPGSYNPVIKVSWPRDNSKIAQKPQENGGITFESRQPVFQNLGDQTPENIDTKANSPDSQGSVGAAPIMHNKGPYKPGLKTAEGGGNRIVPNLTVNFSQPHQTYPGTYNQVIKVYWPKNNSVIRSKPQEDGWQASKSKQPVYQNQGHQTLDNTGNTVNLIDSQGSDHLVPNKEQHDPYKPNLKIQAEDKKNRISPDSTGNFPHPHQTLKSGTYNEVIKVSYPKDNSIMSLKPQDNGGQTSKLGHIDTKNIDTNVNSPDSQGSVGLTSVMHNTGPYKPGLKIQAEGEKNKSSPASTGNFPHPHQTSKRGTYNEVIKVSYPRDNSVMSLKPQKNGGQTSKLGHPVYQISGHQTPDNKNTNVNSPDTKESDSLAPGMQSQGSYKPGLKTQAQGRDDRSSIENFGQSQQRLQPGSYNPVIKVSWPKNNSVMRPKPHEDRDQAPGHHTLDDKNNNSNSPGSQGSVQLAPDKEQNGSYKLAHKTPVEGESNRISSLTGYISPPQQPLPGLFIPKIKTYRPKNINKMVPNPHNYEEQVSQSVQHGYGYQDPKASEHRNTNINLPNPGSVIITPEMQQNGYINPEYIAGAEGVQILPTLQGSLPLPSQAVISDGYSRPYLNIPGQSGGSNLPQNPGETTGNTPPTLQPEYYDYGPQRKEVVNGELPQTLQPKYYSQNFPSPGQRDINGLSPNQQVYVGQPQHSLPYKNFIPYYKTGEVTYIPLNSPDSAVQSSESLEPGYYNPNLNIPWDRDASGIPYNSQSHLGKRENNNVINYPPNLPVHLVYPTESTETSEPPPTSQTLITTSSSEGDPSEMASFNSAYPANVARSKGDYLHRSRAEYVAPQIVGTNLQYPGMNPNIPVEISDSYSPNSPVQMFHPTESTETSELPPSSQSLITTSSSEGAYSVNVAHSNGNYLHPSRAEYVAPQIAGTNLQYVGRNPNIPVEINNKYPPNFVPTTAVTQTEYPVSDPNIAVGEIRGRYQPNLGSNNGIPNNGIPNNAGQQEYTEASLNVQEEGNGGDSLSNSGRLPAETLLVSSGRNENAPETIDGVLPSQLSHDSNKDSSQSSSSTVRENNNELMNLPTGSNQGSYYQVIAGQAGSENLQTGELQNANNQFRHVNQQTLQETVQSNYNQQAHQSHTEGSTSHTQHQINSRYLNGQDILHNKLFLELLSQSHLFIITGKVGLKITNATSVNKIMLPTTQENS